MPGKFLAVATTVLGVVAAVMAFLPYSWAHIVAGAVGAALAALHPVNAAVVKVRAKPNATT